jgi:hypothetical protein
VAGGAAINLDGVQGAFIYNNLLYENHASGIALFQLDGAEPSFNAVIVHNTIINASNGRWCILIVNGSTGAQVFNNIIINQHAWRGSIALDPDAEDGFASDYNIVVNSMSNLGDGVSTTLAEWQDLGYDANSMLAEPMGEIFVAPGSDYHLLDDAQAIDSGNSAFAFGVDEDIEGLSRPQGSQHDIGAYEAEGVLAIDEEEKEEEQNETFTGIKITAATITWSKGLTGILTLMAIDGKTIFQKDIDEEGQYDLQNLVPGIYYATVHDDSGLLWSKGFINSGR